MLFRFTTAFLFTLYFLLPANASLIKVEHFTLANGLQVVLVPNARAPLVTHSIWYRVGSVSEVAGKTGLAHFLEHLVFKGTPKYPADTVEKLMQELGAQTNAFTTAEYTAYFQRLRSDKLELVMDIEADRMKNIVLTDENTLPERDVVKQERRQRIDSDPASLFWEGLNAKQYGTHPKARPVIGHMEDVAALTREDAIAFYRDWYQPKNAIVVITGDATLGQVKQLAEKYYGPLTNDPNTKTQTLAQATLPPSGIRHIVTDPRVQTSMIVKSFLTPSDYGPKARDGLALYFLSYIIGGSTDARLPMKLSQQLQLVAQAGASISGDGQIDYTLTIYAVPNPGVSMRELEAALDEAIAEIRTKGISQEELDREVKRGSNRLVYLLDAPQQMFRIVGSRLVAGEDPQKIFDISEWETVTAEEVNAAAKTYLAPGRAVTGILLRNAQDMTGQPSP